jgi:hypothetical protein
MGCQRRRIMFVGHRCCDIFRGWLIVVVHRQRQMPTAGFKNNDAENKQMLLMEDGMGIYCCVGLDGQEQMDLCVKLKRIDVQWHVIEDPEIDATDTRSFERASNSTNSEHHLRARGSARQQYSLWQGFLISTAKKLLVAAKCHEPGASWRTHYSSGKEDHTCGMFQYGEVNGPPWIGDFRTPSRMSVSRPIRTNNSYNQRNIVMPVPVCQQSECFSRNNAREPTFQPR